MFQRNFNVRFNDMNVVKTEPELVNVQQRALGPFTLPSEMQVSNNNERNQVYQPSLIQRPPSSGIQNNSLPTRSSSVAESSRRTIVLPGPSTLIVTAAHRNSNSVTLTTPADNRGRNDNSLLVAPQKQNIVSVPSPINNSTVQRNTFGNAASSSTSTVQNMGNATSASNNLSIKFYGTSEKEKFFVFTGTAERVIKWNKIFQNHFCFFEVIASVISIQEGSMRTQKIMLLRDKNKGPILQVVYYDITTHMDIEDFHVGQVLRCIGKMSGPNILNAVSIRSATQEETETLQRLSLICDNAVSHFLNV